MSRKRLRYGLGVSLLLSSSVLSGLVSAAAYQQYPLILPQVPLNGPEAPSEDHEFVS